MVKESNYGCSLKFSIKYCVKFWNDRTNECMDGSKNVQIFAVKTVYNYSTSPHYHLNIHLFYLLFYLLLFTQNSFFNSVELLSMRVLLSLRNTYKGAIHEQSFKTYKSQIKHNEKYHTQHENQKSKIFADDTITSSVAIIRRKQLQLTVVSPVI